MPVRAFFLLIPFVLAACQANEPATPAPPKPTDPRVRDIADAYLADYFNRYPELGTIYGVRGRRHNRLPENTPAAITAWRGREDQLLGDLQAIEPASIQSPQLRATYAIARESLEGSVAMRPCRTELWNVSQITGWHTSFGYLVTIQPVDSEQARQEALERWSALPAYIDNEIANLRDGLAKGYSAPKGNVRLVLEEIRTLADAPVAEAPFASPAARDSSPGFQKAFRELIATRINPALRRYVDFLERAYLPAARDAITVSANPNGAACYQGALRNYSTLTMAPADVHAIGRREMERLTAEMKAIGVRSFGIDDVRTLMQHVKADRRYLFRNRRELLAHSEAALNRARAVAPRWFNLLPKSDVKLEPYPPFREKSGPAEYNPPAEDGSHPGLYYVSAYQAEKKSRVTYESTAFHETIPGHHFQIALALERTGIHPIGRYMGSSGYAEGWALYAELLADEMGLFSADLDRLGMLGSQAFRAARLVVDTGIHTMGWSRQQAIDYMVAHTPESVEAATSEIDRYIVWPGQATAYMLGMLEIRAARTEAEATLKPRFDIRQFHDRILEDGSVPLPFLREKVRNWIRASGS